MLGPQLRAQGPDHPHRGGPLLRRVPTRSRLPFRHLSWHGSILVSKVRSLQHPQGDSYTLLLRFHHETGARRGGGLTLRLMDLDYRRGMIELHEKGLTVREVPATEELLRSLIRHCLSRTSPDAPGEQRIFRSKTGNPISRGTYGRVHDRWYQSESLRNLGVTVHWLRHTAIAEYREIGGLSVSTAFAGHSLRNRTTNENYGGAQPADVIDAFERRSGEAHPLGSGTIRPPLTL
ncbi:site-specific integrase [Cellulomonas sp. P24]|uniref:site-specific integrase n=1 Tax=Cellulomonas sp. P24 TaxID=2885206 RepID=UPI00216B0C50|nr:site-specific integrase [Cellulomonas sp. P24]MCR6491157.1 site-specific integrase [Cellulomonas sp. P24]